MRTELTASALMVLGLLFGCGTNGGGTNGGGTSGDDDGGGGTNGDSGPETDEGSIPSGPTNVPVDASSLDAIALSDDGRVVVVLGSGSTLSVEGGYKKHPMLAYERHSDGTFTLLCELPPLEDDFSSRSRQLAISADGGVVSVVESSGGVSSVRAFKREGACYTRLPNALHVGDEREGLTGALLLSRDGTRSLAAYPQYDRKEAFGSDRYFSGMVDSYVNENSRWTFVSPKRRSNAEFGRGLAFADGPDLVIVGEPQLNTPNSSYSSGEPRKLGAAYVFAAGNGELKATLTAKEGVSGSGFGMAVSVSEDGSQILIAAPNGKTLHAFVGSGSAWTEQATIPPPSADVARWGDDVVVSSDGTLALVTALTEKLGETVTSLHLVRRNANAWSRPTVALPNAPAVGLFSMARTAKTVAVEYREGDSAHVVVHPL